MEYLIVDVDSRIIKIPELITHLGVKDDNETRTLKFQMPKVYKGLDLSDYSLEINFINANNKSDSALTENKQIDGDNITFEWCVGRSAYAKNGKVNFLVYAYLENEYGIKTNEWHTTWAKLDVLDGGNVYGAIAEENPRIVEEMLRRIKELENAEKDAVLCTEQELTEEQKEQARKNIRAADEETVSRLSEDVEGIKQNGTGTGTGNGATTAQANSLWALVKKTAFKEALTDEELNAFKTAWGINTETVPATGITLNKTTLSFTVSATQTLIATVEPSNSTDSVTWESSNTGIATVSGGVVTPVSNGSCTITATAGSYSASCTITVNVSEEIVYYTITRNLTNYTSSSTKDRIAKGGSHNEILTIADGCTSDEITITMGGVDVTSDVYGDGTILITEVTGDIVITAIANEPIVNEAVLLKSGSVLNFVDSEGTTISSGNYACFGLVTGIATSDSVAKITITNNTGTTVAKNTSFYAGQTDSYTNENYPTAYDSELVYRTSSLGIEDGNSITFEAKVKKGYLLIFTAVADCDITVHNVIIDESYDTDEYVEYSTSIVDTGARTIYSDDGNTSLVSGNYTYTLVSDNIFDEDTDVIITYRKTESHPTLYNHQTRYIGCFTDGSNHMYHAESFNTKNSGFPTYGYKRLLYTVKAGYKLAISYSSAHSNYDADVVFKSKVV